MTVVPEFVYPSPRRRVARVLAYSLWVIAGILLTASPSEIIAGNTSGYIVYVWAIFMMVGGIFSFIGAATDRWIGEYTGLPLVISTLWLYGGILTVASFTGEFSYVRLAIGLLFVSFGLKALGRWQDIRDLVKAHRERLRSKRQNGDV